MDGHRGGDRVTATRCETGVRAPRCRRLSARRDRNDARNHVRRQQSPAPPGPDALEGGARPMTTNSECAALEAVLPDYLDGTLADDGAAAAQPIAHIDSRASSPAL